MVVGKIINKFINVFTGLFGIATVVMMLLIYINNAMSGHLLFDHVYTIRHLKEYFTLATVFCAGLEFTLKRNIILAIIFAAIIVAVLVFMLYTDFAM